MPRQPKPKPDNPEQFKRFIEAARDVGAEADPKTFDRVLDKVAHSPKRDHRETKEKKPPERSAASHNRRKG
jgi:hypothetical protein